MVSKDNADVTLSRVFLANRHERYPWALGRAAGLKKDLDTQRALVLACVNSSFDQMSAWASEDAGDAASSNSLSSVFCDSASLWEVL